MLLIGLILVGGVIMGGLIWQFRQTERDTKPIRVAAASQPITFRADVQVKVMLWTGWSSKTLGGLEVVVRDSVVQISPYSPLNQTRGEPTSSEWILDARMTTVEAISIRRQLSTRRWISI